MISMKRVSLCTVILVLVFIFSIYLTRYLIDNHFDGADSTGKAIELEKKHVAIDNINMLLTDFILEQKIRSIVSSRQEHYSVLVRTLNHGKNEKEIIINPEKMRSASMIKLFIMAEAFRQVKDGLLDEKELITIQSKDIVGGAGSLQSHPEGTRKTLRQLIELMITESDNTATNVVIDKVGMKEINSLIKRIGCNDTILQRKMMDFASIRAGRENYTSVKDLGLFFHMLHQGKIVNSSFDKIMVGILCLQEDNDKIPQGLPAGKRFAHKTGELVGALHDAGIVFESRGDFIICVMTEEVTNQKRTTETMRAVAKAVYAHLTGESVSR